MGGVKLMDFYKNEYCPIIFINLLLNDMIGLLLKREELGFITSFIFAMKFYLTLFFNLMENVQIEFSLMMVI